ncbi:MAG: hypothetical protein N2438_08505 [Limisphaera sp.]|nr:hypothetical protein [Limisphaera sp.]
MNTPNVPSRARTFLCVAGLALAGVSHAYPPAPHHIIEGVIRDPYGVPLSAPSARILFETATGRVVETRLRPEMGRGLNYTLTLPLDAGVTPELYRPSALQPLVPFRIRVRIGSTTYLPIEMRANLATLGQPAQRTRLDLTLGEDRDGDGLPDMWEYALIQQLGGGQTLQDIRPGDDLDRDGLSNLQEYLAGTYAFDPGHALLLDLREVQAGQAILEFTAVTGRTYQILVGHDLQTWSVVPFKVAGSTEAPATEYRANDIRLLRVQVSLPDAGSNAPPRFFRLKVL